MAVEFDHTGTKYIKWTAPAGAIGLSLFTVDVMYYRTGAAANYFWIIYDGVGTDTDQAISFSELGGADAGKLGMQAHWSTLDGTWKTTSAVLTSSAFNRVSFTYDASSTSNNPVFYINGVSTAVTTVNAPTGTYRNGTGVNLFLGIDGASLSMNGIYNSCNQYNRIASASEILDWHNSKLAIPDKRGLVFAAQLQGCAGGVAEGGTMAAGNTVADAVSGALGVPAGSPLFKGDTVLTFGG